MLSSINFISFNRKELSEISQIAAIAYNSLLDTLIVADSKSILEYDMNFTALHILVEEGVTSVTSMGMDEVGGNIYWSDGSGAVTVMSLATRQKLVLIEHLKYLCGVLVISEQRSRNIIMWI